MNKCFLLLGISLGLALSYATLVTAEDTVEVQSRRAPMFTAPGGQRVANAAEGAQLKVLEVHGEWLRVSMEGWIEQVATTYNRKAPRNVKAIKATSGLVLVGFDIRKISKYETGDLARVELKLRLKNNATKLVKAWSGMLVVEHVKGGGPLFTAPVSSTKKTVAAGGEQEFSFYWSDEERPYFELTSFPKEALKVRIESLKQDS